jgi:hypothetical protein
MRRCLSLFVVGLVGCLALSPAGFAMIAAPREDRLQSDGVRAHFTMTIAGTLRRVVPGKVFPDGREIYCPDYARAYYTVTSAALTYRLDFSDRDENQVLAGLLLGQRVVVTGERQGDRLRVLKLKADPTEQPIDQVQVAATGKLRWRIYRASDGELLAYCDTLPSPFPKSWGCSVVLAVAGKHEPLTLPSDALRTQSGPLMGKSVRITGSLKGGTIVVTTLERAVGSWVHKTVRVEVSGELVWNSPLRVEPPLRGPQFSVVVGGKSYGLRFLDKMQRNLAAHVGKTVLVTGTLETGSDGHPVILVSTFKAQPGYVKETGVQVEIKGRLTAQWKTERLMIWPPRPSSASWRVEAEGKTYHLAFTSKELGQKALKLEWSTVLLRGTLVNGVVRVTALEPSCDG